MTLSCWRTEPPATDNLGIPGEDLPGSYTATEFVAWYNGHPDYRDRKFDLSGKVAVVIGQGNVAADVCRILCKTTDELKIPISFSYALEVLAQSKIQEVHMVGRRGPAQAAFTPIEIREFGELADCDPVVNPAELELNPASRAELEIVKELTRKKISRPCRSSRRWVLPRNEKIFRPFFAQPR